jgi:hypothetical protein
LILEAVAIVTALLLILVDYKLKNDLMDLYKKMERALADGRQILGSEFGSGIDTSSLRASPLVRDAAPVETGNDGYTYNANSKPEPSGRKTEPKRTRRDGYTEIPKPDKQVGS